jgi:hypothetical protein
VTEAKQTGGTVSAVVAASLIMVTPQRLRQLVNEGFIPKPKARDAYSLVGVVQGYIKFLKDEERRSNRVAGDTRVRDARAEEIEMRIEERSRALVKEAIAVSMAALDEAAGGLKSDLLSIPARVTKDIPLRRKIENEINDALGEASKRARAAAEAHERIATLWEKAPSLQPDEWARQNRVYARSSGVPGRREPLLTPYVIAFERFFSSDEYETCALITGTQMGKTDAILDVIGWRVDTRPRPQLYVGPSRDFVAESSSPG